MMLPSRREQPFITVSCATIPLDRAESEMFGHELRSSPGARNARVGLVEQAADFQRGGSYVGATSDVKPRYTRRQLWHAPVLEDRMVA
jgi:transcriptional regulator of aromatic amino acid metabolism